MAKPKTLTPITRARRALIRAGATSAQIDALELAVIEQVMNSLSTGGEIAESTRQRYRELKGETDR